MEVVLIRTIVISLLTLATLLLAAAPAQAAPDLPVEEPQCMPVYREMDFGAVRYVSRDTCSAELYVNDEQVWPPSVPQSGAAIGCVLVIHIADYSWTYVCVEPKDTSCPVYVKEVRGNQETRTCYAGVEAPAGAAEATCIPTSGGMDYHSYACVDPKSSDCKAYTLSSSDRGVEKRCYGLLEPSPSRCLDVYNRMDVGPVTYESRSSCQHEVYVFGKPLLG